MTVDTTGFPPQLPLTDITDGGGGGGDTGDGEFSRSAPSDTPAEPTVIDLSDENALIRVKGSDKPVKYGEHVRGFQSQFTKASQRAAQLERELQVERQSRQRYEQERAQSQRQGGSNQPDVYEALKQLPYLDGEMAAQVVQGISGEIRERDQILLGMAQQMQKMYRTLSGLHETHSTSAFDAKINNWLSQGGYPPEAADLAKEIYLAYEGDDLDAEFPRIFAERFEQIEKLIDARKSAAVARNRSRFVPGRGGTGSPGKPLQFKGGESAKEIADSLFASFSTSGT